MLYKCESKEKNKILGQLFLTNLYISAFTFGGGFVIITFMKSKYVNELHWLDEEEMLDLTALAQSSPGAIAVNASILIGWRMAGLAGMLAATAGTILPPMLILSVLSFFYTAFADNPYVALVLKGMQAGAAAVILDVVCSLGQNVLKEKSALDLCLMVAVFFSAFFLNINVIFLILAAVFAGIIRTVHVRKKR
ncbi:MAG: chromate transporter [Eubacteriales bacterium]|nr:chromate transporter [Eubacteriales bacterium]